MEGNGVARRWVGEAVKPILESSRSGDRLLSVERTEAGLSRMDDQNVLSFYSNAMDLRVDGPRIWRPPHASTAAATVISWGDGTAPSAVEMPLFPDARESELKFLAARFEQGHLFLLRGGLGQWELSDYDISANSWRRAYIVLSHDQIAPIVYGKNALTARIKSMEIHEDRIVLEGLGLRSDQTITSLVDSGFRIEVARP